MEPFCLSQHCHLLLVFKVKGKSSSVSMMIKIDLFLDPDMLLVVS